MPCETARLAANRLKEKRQLEDRLLEDAPTHKSLQVLSYQLSNLHLSFFFFKGNSNARGHSCKDTGIRCWGGFVSQTPGFPPSLAPAHAKPTSSR